jgi:hypothetical protein
VHSPPDQPIPEVPVETLILAAIGVSIAVSLVAVPVVLVLAYWVSR